MTESEAKSLFENIQRAFDTKDLASVLKFYHPEISYIGPAFSHPLEGIVALKTALVHYFEGPQRTRAIFKDIKVRNLSSETFLVHCMVEGSRTIYLCETRFMGYLSRVLVIGEGGLPLVIYEHFSLLG